METKLKFHEPEHYFSSSGGHLEELAVVDGSAVVLVHLLELLVQLLDVHRLQLLSGRKRLHHRVNALIPRLAAFNLPVVQQIHLAIANGTEAPCKRRYIRLVL